MINGENEIRVRTDLALETKESLEADGSMSGVIFDEEYDEERDIRISRLEILNSLGERNMGRARGIYYTFETSPMSFNDGEYHRDISVFLAKYLRDIISKHLKEKKTPYHVLVVGLGNREATPDALGPYVVNNLDITEGIGSGEENVFAYVSALSPGVMAQTGMETAEILKGVVDSTHPDCIIVVDALAARSTTRLANTIQLADTGIMPGSGVGNHRNAIDSNNMGVPVIAIGVPTVVDAATIVGDAMEKMLLALEEHSGVMSIRRALDSFNDSERKQFMWELMPENMSGMYVTPKDVDETVKRISYTLSEAINIAMQA